MGTETTIEDRRFVATTERRAGYYKPGLYLVWDRNQQRPVLRFTNYQEARSAAAKLNHIVREGRIDPKFRAAGR